MKKVLASLFSLVLLVAVVGCSSSDSETDCSNGNIIMITDTGGVEDASFNQGTYEGVLKLVDESDGVCSKAIESTNEADYAPNLNTASEENPDLIVAAGFKFGDSMLEVATDNEDQNFLLIDMVVADENGEQLPNVASAVFAEHEGSYLVGVAAAMKAKQDGHDTVGFVGGEESELINKFAAGYKAGVLSVDPDMKVLITYTGTFVEPGKGKAEADKLYGQGAYIIYHAAGGSGNGVISAAQDIYNQADSPEDAVWVIGVDRNQYEEGKVDKEDSESHSVILTSMLKKVDVASYDVSKLTIDGKFPGGEILTFNLENDGVGIPDENPNLDDEIVKAVEAAKQDVLDGNVVVPETLD
ncbi:MAG: BMP family protein [Bacilli bacterium]